MSVDPAANGPAPGRFAANVLHFGRVLRAAGMPIGSDRIRLALEALAVVGFGSREDLHATLAACLVDRVEHRLLFDQAFHLFWRDPDLRGRMLAMLLPRVTGHDGLARPPSNRRLADALFPASVRTAPTEEQSQIEFDAALTASDRERLFKADFDTMSAAEWAEAKRVIATLPLALAARPTRRLGASTHGRVDWRRTLRASARGDGLRPRRVAPRPRIPPIVVVADISGSMSRYSRMLLHFAHALTQRTHGKARRVETFVFGTRLTSITRALRDRDPDAALISVVRTVDDWSGGTRIAECLAEFNGLWSRRVLGGDATVLLVTDGLERGDVERLGFEVERLSKSCRTLVWLNPLLRFDGFEPRAAGIRAMLPHVDRFVPAHNLDGIVALGAALSNDHDVRTTRWS